MTFTKETAAAAGRNGARKTNAQRREAKDREITPVDEARAIAVLRRNMRSKDERVAQAAAIKLLEYTKGKPSTPDNDEPPTRIIFETHFLPPKGEAERLARDGDEPAG